MIYNVSCHFSILIFNMFYCFAQIRFEQLEVTRMYAMALNSMDMLGI